MIYILLFIFILLFGIFDFYYIPKIKKVFFVSIIGVFLILIGGLRWETGTDWESYINYFTSNRTYDEFVNFDFEYLYALLSFSVKHLTSSYTVFLLVFCFLTISIKLYGFCRISNYDFVFLTILMYYANQLGDVSPTRQSLAMSFGVLGLLFIIRRKLIPFLLTMVIAMLFHISAIISILAVPIIYLDITRRHLISFMGVGFAMGIFIFTTGSNNFIFSFFMSGDGVVADKLAAYQEIQEIGYSTTGSGIDPKVSYILGAVRRCFVLIPALYFYDILSKRNDNFKTLINIYTIGSLIYLIFTPVMQVLNRMSAYFDVAEYLILPLFTTIPNQRYIRIFIYVILVLYAASKFYSTILSFWEFYNPYKICF